MSKHPPAAHPPPTRKPGQPPYVATDKDRLTVKVMIAGGIEQSAIAAVLGITPKTLRKHFRHEIDAGAPEMFGRVVASLFSMATTGKNVHAAKWITQARMGWREHIVVDDGKPADQPMRVIVELVGEAAPPRVEQSAPRSGQRLPGVQLVG